MVLTARQTNPNLTIVARAAEERTINKPFKAGVDRVISPYQIAGRRMASYLLRPTVMNFLDVVVEGGYVPPRLEEVVLGAGSHRVGCELRASGIGSQMGAIILGVHSADGWSHVNRAGGEPVSRVVIERRDVLLALGSDDQLSSLRAVACVD